MTDTIATAVESIADLGDGPGATVRRWLLEIAVYEKEAGEWPAKSDKIVKRYLDERGSEDDSKTKFNVLWSNIETLRPALYSRIPKPQVERRFKDASPVARTAAEVLERSIAFNVDEYDFDDTVKAAVMDYLLPGRGQVWVRYVPFMGPAAEVEGAPETGEMVSNSEIEDDTGEVAPPAQEVVYEQTVCDYVHWKDFGHTVARRWAEVRAVWRKVYMTRAEMVDRFGAEKGGKVGLDYTPEHFSELEQKDENNESFKKAVVYEIWDKSTRKALWISKGYPDDVLDEVDDPLRLRNFFPCPRPMLATTSNDSLIPVPDFIEYQDQADEMDNLTARIAMLTDSLRVAGVYNKDADEEGRIAELVDPRSGNIMVPVSNWAAFAQSGGMNGAISWMPIEEVATVITTLYTARAQVKADLYEITGISDIMRGQGDASETATAQRIKGQFGTMRLKERQAEAQRFIRDIMRIKGEIIAEHFSPDTLRVQTGIEMPDAAPPMMPPPTGMAPGAAPVSAKSQPATWADVMALLRNDAMRSFAIDIETDSTIAVDDEEEKKSVSEFFSAVGSLLTQAMPIIQAAPETGTMFGEMLLFGVRRFRAGRQLEGAIESAINQMQQKASAPPAEPQPDPAMMEAQGRMQLEQQKLAAEDAKAQAAMQMDQQRMAGEAQVKNDELLLKAREIEQAPMLAEIAARYDHQARIEIARIEQETALEVARIKARADAAAKTADAIGGAVETVHGRECEMTERGNDASPLQP